jgi:hypothetical protein
LKTLLTQEPGFETDPANPNSRRTVRLLIISRATTAVPKGRLWPLAATFSTHVRFFGAMPSLVINISALVLNGVASEPAMVGHDTMLSLVLAPTPFVTFIHPMIQD